MARRKKIHQFKKGEGLSVPWAQKVENFVESFQVVGGGWFSFDGKKAIMQVYKGGFSGEAYTPAGAITTGLTDATKPWVKYELSTGVITEETGPPAEPWGASETWRKKSDFTGAIYF